MRQVAMQRGARFHCASVNDLLDATSEWFQSLIEESLSYEECMDEEKLHLHTPTHHADDEDALSCKTRYLHHLIVLPV